MDDLTLAALENQVWSLIGTDLEPKFAFLGCGERIRHAFLRIGAISHPFFGRAKLCVLSSESTQFATEFQKFDLAQKQGLIRLETVESIEELIKDATVVLDSNAPFPQEKAKAVLDLAGLDLEGVSLNVSPEDPYRYVHAYLGLYGCPLSEFRLPQKPTEGPLLRDWHYLGPSRDLEAYRLIEDELRLGLANADGSLCPKESHDIFLRALRDEEVSGKELYAAIVSCYTQPCLLRDMASYQHDTWILRTLAFLSDPTSKASLLTPYPLLLAREVEKLSGLSLEESLKKDILFSDFLVPLYFVKTLLQ